MMLPIHISPYTMTVIVALAHRWLFLYTCAVLAGRTLNSSPYLVLDCKRVCK